MKLTIGQVAAYVGVTIRAIRHYHHSGLLTEPDRDASGYRRYDASAVVDLIKIKTLADSGVPLGRIKELLQAEPDEFARAVDQIDSSLDAKIRELTEQKRRVAAWSPGDTLFLPPKIVDLLDGLRAIGVSERTIKMERDGWIVLAARATRTSPGTPPRPSSRRSTSPSSGRSTSPTTKRRNGTHPTPA